MSKSQQDWWNRPLEVTTYDLCDHCNTLQTDVKKRDWSNYSYYDKKTVEMTSCQKCFDLAVLAKKAETKSTYTGWGLID